MPFDNTGLSFVIDDDDAGFTTHMRGDWPRTLFDLIGSTANLATGQNDATSSSSVTFDGAAQKTFTLDAARAWQAGNPVIAYDPANPDTKVLGGTLDTDEAAGVITINVSFYRGSGTVTSWNLVRGIVFADIVTPPVAVVDGGTGTNSEANTRAAFELIRHRTVLSILSVPPGSPSEGDAHLVGELPTGAFALHENEIAVYVGAAWTFVDFAAGELIYDEAAERQYLRVSSQQTDGLWSGARWVRNTPTSSGVKFLADVDYGTTLTVDTVLETPRLVAKDHTATLDITLPNPGTDTRLLGHEIVVFLGNSFTVTVDVAGGGSINGFSSITLATVYSYLRLLGIGTNWYAKVGG